MEIKKTRDVYEITDTYKGQSVTGTGSTDAAGNVVVNLTIGNVEVYYNVYPSENSYGINITIGQFDADIVKYLTDIANTIINPN